MARGTSSHAPRPDATAGTRSPGAQPAPIAPSSPRRVRSRAGSRRLSTSKTSVGRRLAQPPAHISRLSLCLCFGGLLLRLVHVSLLLVHLRLGAGLGLLALFSALVRLRLAFDLQRLVVGDVAGSFLDLALGFFQKTHLGHTFAF